MELQNLKIPNIQISTRVPHNLWALAIQNHIKWADAIKFGIQMKLADKGVADFPHCSLKIKFNKMRELYENILKEKEIKAKEKK